MDFDFLTWLSEGGWVTPLIGMGVFGTALLFGRKLFAAKPVQPQPQQSPEELFEAYFLSNRPRERRRAPRRSGNPIEVVLDDGSELAQGQGWILDRSIGGLGVLVNAPVSSGTVLKVRAKETGATTPWVEVSVRFCKPHGGQHELGCQFQRIPSWNDLMQFG